ncbi:TrmH family RNA methyltransferase [Actinoalloteichus hymeniacidonis]|uniref:TrmH family RNA methyltransferase n=1 Tax=Actinoalloteichus hymeniacidonis TaxID=340345 RepID=UPI000852C3AD|nr:RNA methyltransferase [Actinoalloteichus hymeniacidonis]MBB5906095.1 tRNA G18 (ribose-2'-O)-methylase SpoU [Actinoalloteichus hymeniacidonis]
MAHWTLISDPDSSEVDDFRDLSAADRRPDRPGGRGLVIAEGTVVVRRLLASPYPVRAVLGVERRVADLMPDLADRDIPAFVTSAEVMAEIVGFHLNRGVLAVADRAPQPTAEELMASARTLAVLEGIGDHENLGALFRNAAALGIDGVLIGAGCSDPLYRRSVRVSMGHVLRVPFAELRPWPEGLELLRDAGFRIAALTPDASALPLSHFELASGKGAVLLGSEGPGLTDEAMDWADLRVRIPMAGDVDSLNVATAAAIAFHHLGVFPEPAEYRSH